MKTIDINAAKNEFLTLIELASQGEEIIITKQNQPMAKLISYKQENKRPSLFGSDKDIISISDDFDEPLEDFKHYV